MKNKIQKHLLNNKGDIYMYFLFFMIAVILMFSAVFGLMQLRIMSNHIYTEIETSADVVFANIKKECYQTLIDGTTENTVMSQLNTSVVMNQLAEHLDAEIVSDQIIKQDESRTYFIIRNLIIVKYKILW